jgi:hypothetical protein
VLEKVLPVLLRVPFKSHGSPRLGENTFLSRICQYICMYSLLWANSKSGYRHHRFKDGKQMCPYKPDMAERVGYSPWPLSLSYHLFSNMHENRIQIRDFRHLACFNCLSCFVRLGLISALDRHQRHQ